MDALKHITDKYNLDITKPSPIEIPNVGRAELASLFAELGHGVGAEIGVFKGVYSEIICRANPTVELYCVDMWKNYDDFYIPDMENAEQTARDRLKDYNVHYLHTDSVTASMQIEDGSLDFVYIDGNHEWLYVAQDLYYWSRKVRKGGIVAGHDYKKLKHPYQNMHVVSVVNGFTDAYKIRPWFIFGTRAKVPGQIRDTTRSWMWVK